MLVCCFFRRKCVSLEAKLARVGNLGGGSLVSRWGYGNLRVFSADSSELCFVNRGGHQGPLVCFAGIDCSQTCSVLVSSVSPVINWCMDYFWAGYLIIMSLLSICLTYATPWKTYEMRLHRFPWLFSSLGCFFLLVFVLYLSPYSGSLCAWSLDPY